MDNFFYNDVFFTDIEDVMNYLDLDEENIHQLPEDWQIECELTTEQPVFQLTHQMVVNAVYDATDRYEDRVPEDETHFDKKVKDAIVKGIDIEKINNALPKYHYANGEKAFLTKKDLIEYSL